MVRLPVPKNKILLFTLVGAVLTGAVAVGLAYPGVISGDDGTAATTPSTATQDGGGFVDAPAPNQSFTPQVSDSGYGEEYEHEEYEEYEEEGDEGHEEEEHEEESRYEEEGYEEEHDD